MLIDSSSSNWFVRESAKLLEPDSIRDYSRSQESNRYGNEKLVAAARVVMGK